MKEDIWREKQPCDADYSIPVWYYCYYTLYMYLWYCVKYIHFIGAIDYLKFYFIFPILKILYLPFFYYCLKLHFIFKKKIYAFIWVSFFQFRKQYCLCIILDFNMTSVCFLMYNSFLLFRSDLSDQKLSLLLVN